MEIKMETSQLGGRDVVWSTVRSLIYYDVKYKPHCLSRGFRGDEGNLGHMNGDAISPQSIEEVLQIGDYERFVAEMESRVYDAIPFGIGGDFETFTVLYSKEFIPILRL
jgi:tyrosinase